MTPENLYAPDCIRTYTGIYMNVFEPTLEMIYIEDIAHGLSMQCRFGGHLPNFYSVAEHSCRCSDLLLREFALEALLHDASEAYLMDIPRPIKNRLTNYKEIEEKLMIKIFEKFGLIYPIHEFVKQADEIMLQREWDMLMLKKENYTNINFDCWSPQYAESKFLSTFTILAASKTTTL